MWYRAKLTFFKNARLNRAWRHWRARRGRPPGHYHRLFELIGQAAPGRSFADIGCMWGVNGAHAFAAEAAGARAVKAVDVFGPTPEFEAAHTSRQSAVEFILGDCTDPETLERIGVVDVVFCAGVLYHHPSPFDVLVALRRICGARLILRTSTIPEIDGMPNAAVFYPMLPDRVRRRWNLTSLGLLNQKGIANRFDPADGYGNWFWGLTPSCLTSMLRVAGFEVERRDDEPFAQTIIAAPASAPFACRLPTWQESRRIAREISRAGISRPA
jgi:2-polyprenyl-3-methyl-5-hydroxy-6-metoxy-1,4-benzoquinol methylase